MPSAPSKQPVRIRKAARVLAQKLILAESLVAGWRAFSKHEQEQVRRAFFREILLQLDSTQRKSLAELVGQPLPPKLPRPINRQRKTKLSISTGTYNLMMARGGSQSSVIEQALACAMQYPARFRVIWRKLAPLPVKRSGLTKAERAIIRRLKKQSLTGFSSETDQWLLNYKRVPPVSPTRDKTIYPRLSSVAEGRLKLLCGMRGAPKLSGKVKLGKLVNPWVDRRTKGSSRPFYCIGEVVEAALKLLIEVENKPSEAESLPSLMAVVQRPLVGFKVPKPQAIGACGISLAAIPIGLNVLFDPFVLLQALTSPSTGPSAFDSCNSLLESCVAKQRFGVVIATDLCLFYSQLVDPMNYETPELAIRLRSRADDLFQSLFDNVLTVISPDAGDFATAAKLPEIPDLSAALRVVLGQRLYGTKLAIATADSTLDQWTDGLSQVFKPGGAVPTVPKTWHRSGKRELPRDENHRFISAKKQRLTQGSELDFGS